MEITAKPRRRGPWRGLRAFFVVAALVCVACLIPPAVGLETHVVADDAMAGTHSRGSLVFDEGVSMGQLAVGDVVTFTTPGGDDQVTRRIVGIDDRGLRTRGDAAAVVDPWQVAPGSAERVAFSLPLLGYPLLAFDSLSVPPWSPAVLALGLAVLLVLLRRTAAAAESDATESALPEGVQPARTTRPLG